MNLDQKKLLKAAENFDRLSSELRPTHWLQLRLKQRAKELRLEANKPTNKE